MPVRNNHFIFRPLVQQELAERDRRRGFRNVLFGGEVNEGGLENGLEGYKILVRSLKLVLLLLIIASIACFLLSQTTFQHHNLESILIFTPLCCVVGFKLLISVFRCISTYFIMEKYGKQIVSQEEDAKNVSIKSKIALYGAQNRREVLALGGCLLLLMELIFIFYLKNSHNYYNYYIVSIPLYASLGLFSLRRYIMPAIFADPIKVQLSMDESGSIFHAILAWIPFKLMDDDAIKWWIICVLFSISQLLYPCLETVYNLRQKTVKILKPIYTMFLMCVLILISLYYDEVLKFSDYNYLWLLTIPIGLAAITKILGYCLKF
jgi:hypothetical protein